jgi:hypothetical protein
MAYLKCLHMPRCEGPKNADPLCPDNFFPQLRSIRAAHGNHAIPSQNLAVAFKARNSTPADANGYLKFLMQAFK